MSKPQTFTFEQAKAAVDRLDAELVRTSAAINAFPKSPRGLTMKARRLAREAIALTTARTPADRTGV